MGITKLENKTDETLQLIYILFANDDSSVKHLLIENIFENNSSKIKQIIFWIC